MHAALIAALTAAATVFLILAIWEGRAEEGRRRRGKLQWLGWAQGDEKYFLALSLLLPVGFFLLGGWFLPGWVGRILGGGAGVAFARNLLQRYHQKLQEQKAQQIAETLELVARAMAAGFNLAQGLGVAAREIPPPFGLLLQQLQAEVELGLDLAAALENLARRGGDPELELAVTALQVQKRLGGEVATVLTEAAAVIRDRLRYRGRLQAVTAQGRLTAVVVTALPLAVLLLERWLAPSFVAPLFTATSGQMVLLLAGGLELAGVYCLHRMLRLKEA